MTRVRSVVALLVLVGAGVAAPFAISAIGGRSSASATVTIKVTASEFKFALSKKSVAPGTTVVFKVTNKGKIGHDFKINGKKTPLIQPGKTATLKVVFKKKGRLTYLCTLTGHAALGMKGSFAVGVKPVTTSTVTTTTGGTTTGTTTGGGGGGGACSTPTSTVNVGLVEYTFNFDKTSVPAGCIQFVITNNGREQHNFDIQGVKAGAILSPGGSETWAVQLGAGTKQVVCDVPFHIDRGMTASFTVT